MRPCHSWTRAELDLLATVYPTGGTKAAQAAFPQLTSEQIRGKIRALDLHIEGRAEYRQQASNEWIDAQIRRAYRTPQPALAKLAREMDRTVGWLKWRAGELGVRREKPAPWRKWEEAEKAIVDDGINHARSIRAIHKRLRQAGFIRSVGAINTYIYKNNLTCDRGFWCANEVAVLLGIDTKTALGLIQGGYLKTQGKSLGPTSRFEESEVAEGRQMYRITPALLRRFLLQHPARWDHRKMQKEVLLDLLCGGKEGLNVFGFGTAGAQ